MNIRKMAIALTAVASLAVPTGAMAHGSVWQTTSKIAGTAVGGVVPTSGQASYAVTNHGYTMVFKETNGVTDHGMINYKVLPSAYRNQAGFTLSRLLSEGDTPVQTHATCAGSSGTAAALWTPEAIASWQSQTPSTPAGAEPFWNYVPWQKVATGLGDGEEVAVWIEKVKDLTGIDLATTTDFAAACTSIGGTYTAADAVATTTASLNSAYAADVTASAVAPLNTQIASLGTQLTGLQADLASANSARDGAIADLASANAAKATALSDLAAANAAKATALSERNSAISARDAAVAQVANLNRVLSVGTAAATLKGSVAGTSGAPVTVSGPGGRAVTVKLTISDTQRANLKLGSTEIGSASGTIAAGGSSTITVQLATAAKAKIKGIKSSVAVTITVTSGDRIATRAWKFTA